jgi:gamma-glutamyltranspeptidase/glutathione hydrolase
MKHVLSLLKRAGLAVLGLIVLGALAGAVVLWLLPSGPRDPMQWQDPWNQPRPMVVARDFVVVTGSPWATEAAMAVLERGGNAFDAAVAALLVLNVTNGEAASFPGIAPLVLYDAGSERVRSYVGAGTAPAAATIERFRAAGHETMPDLHAWAQLVPASPDVIVALMSEYGTMSFSELSAPAVAIARAGFPVHRIMARNLDLSLVERLGLRVLMPYNAEVYLGGEWWRPLHDKDRFTRPELADTWEAMARAEQTALAAGSTRAQALAAVRRHFYEGPIARAILQAHEDEDGLFTAADLAGYAGAWEEPLQGRFGPYTFYTNGTWSQGIVVLLALQILAGVDLAAMGHGSAEYVHTVAQAIELAQADRDAYAGDPRFVDVPLARLLSAEYASERRAAMTPRAFPALPAPGQAMAAPRSPGEQGGPHGQRGPDHDRTSGPRPALARAFLFGKDTTHLAIIDRGGNAISMTPSDFPKSPMVPGTGMTLGNRMIQFRLDPDDVNALAPGKRPRVTPHALVVLRDGALHMAYGTPGGDMQPQASIQVFLNMAVFGMSVQEAIDAPRFRTLTAPSSFAPHEALPATLWLEQRLHERVAGDLRGRGYRVEPQPDWHDDFGAIGAVLRTQDGSGDRLLAGSDPRAETWAAGR